MLCVTRGVKLAVRGVKLTVCDARCAIRGVRREVALSATVPISPSESAANFALALLRTAAVANQNHYSTSGGITIFVCSVHYFRSSYAA